MFPKLTSVQKASLFPRYEVKPTTVSVNLTFIRTLNVVVFDGISKCATYPLILQSRVS